MAVVPPEKTLEQLQAETDEKETTKVAQKLEPLVPPEESYDYHEHKFDQTDGIKLNQGVTLDQGAKFRDLISVWNWEGKKVPVPARWHPHGYCRE